MKKDPFEEYLREGEPDKASKGYVWSTAIGLQAVDGLKPSKYLIDTAIQNIEGKITLKEANDLIENYYEEKPDAVADNRTEDLQTNIFPFITDYSKGYIPMPEKSEIIISQKKSGFWMEKQFYMEALRN